jgi:ADP-ribose pyrophosphatase YjhB (NUDIX family)
MEKQMTATAYIIHEDKVLLLLHPKLNKWLPPGGHLEANELPPEGAIRETLEETGLEIALLKDEHLWVERWNAQSFERPWQCLLEHIPAYQDKPAHQHIDFVYLAKVVGGSISQAHQDLQPIRWFSCEEVLALKADEEIFVETQMTIQKIFEEAVIQC